MPSGPKNIDSALDNGKAKAKALRHAGLDGVTEKGSPSCESK